MHTLLLLYHNNDTATVSNTFFFSFRLRFFFYSLANSRSSQHIEEIHGNEEKTENM